MLGITTCHVNQAPSGVWTFVGSVPAELLRWVPASKSAVMGGRAKMIGGKVMEWKIVNFPTEVEARAFAAEKGVELAN